jgi:hypothetical protein
MLMDFTINSVEDALTMGPGHAPTIFSMQHFEL